MPGHAFAQEAPRRGGVMTVHFATEQRILNPSLQASTGVYLVGGKIQEPLVDLDAEGNPAPCLAESWESSRDGQTITFRLRRDVTWHDGRPFTSTDVQFTAMEMWKKILNYGTAVQLFLTRGGHAGPAHRRVPLRAADAAEPAAARAAGPRLHLAEACLRRLRHRQNPANTAPVGTGPYRFVQYERGQFIIAERNPNYWRNGMPYLDRVVWRVVSDRSAAAAQMEAGQILFSPYSSLTIADLQRLGRDPRFEVTTKGNEGNARNNTLEFNFRNPVLADIRVRRAIAHAIDVPFFIENFLGEFAKQRHRADPLGLDRLLPVGADAAIRLRPPPRECAAGRGRASPRRRRRALQPAPAPRRPGARTSRCGPPSSSNRCRRWASASRSCARRRGLPAHRLQRLELRPGDGWHQYRNDPAVSTSVWYRSGQPKGAPWTNQWGWRMRRPTASWMRRRPSWTRRGARRSTPTSSGA
jgi:peptide/nickel transport system substrate-binding protein